MSDIITIRKELNAQFFERRDLINGLLVAMLTREHLFTIGEPGTAKSAIIRELSKRVRGSSYFEWLMTKFTSPGEIFGAESLADLKKGIQKRLTVNKLPEADFAFLDEFYKSNSAIGNALLTIMNERIFHNNGTPMQCPLQTLVGASNELPNADDGLAAQFDRFLFKYEVKYIQDDTNFVAMLKGGSSNKFTTITKDELTALQSEVDQVFIPDEVLSTLVEIRNEMKKAGYTASDRKWVKSLKALQGFARLSDRDMVGEDDFEILPHILWLKPEDLRPITRIVFKSASPLSAILMEHFDAAESLYKEFVNQANNGADKSKIAAETRKGLVTIKDQLEKVRATTNGRSTQVDTVIAKVDKFTKEVVEALLRS